VISISDIILCHKKLQNKENHHCGWMELDNQIFRLLIYFVWLIVL